MSRSRETDALRDEIDDLEDLLNEPIQIIVALNHFFHLELVTRTSLLIG